MYHKDGIGTHCFRPANSNDEPPENHYHAWQFPALVGWNGYPAGVREKLSQADFGSAHFGLRDDNFASHLAKAKPSGITFDPNAYRDRVRVGARDSRAPTVRVRDVRIDQRPANP